MTDTNNVDALLRNAFARAAEPGDPTGVVDSIRTRMAAGDTGTPASNSGFGGGLKWLIPFIAGGLVLAVVGVVLGASGFFGTFTHITNEAIVAPPSATPTAVEPTPTVIVTPTPTSAPVETDAPPPVRDTVAPTVTVGSFSPTPVYGLSAATYCETVTRVTVTVSDNVGVATLKGASNFAGGALAVESSSASSYVFTYSANYDQGQDVTVIATFTATDTAGNVGTATQKVTLSSAGNCLI